MEENKPIALPPGGFGDSLSRLRQIHSVLVATDSPLGFLKVLVHTVFAVHGAVGSYLAVLLDSSKLLVVDSYGYETVEFMSNSSHSVWSHTAANDAIRSGEIVAFANFQEYIKSYPKNAKFKFPGDGFVGIPIWITGFPTAVVGVSFVNPHPERGISEIVDLAEHVRLVMEITYDRPLWLGAQNGQLIEAGREMLPTSLEFVPHAISIPPDSQLTERQHDILRGIQDGHTNRQIAYHLHVSESTIGKETIEIYRKLRVKTRRDAVLTAESSGRLGVAGQGEEAT